MSKEHICTKKVQERKDGVNTDRTTNTIDLKEVVKMEMKREASRFMGLFEQSFSDESKESILEELRKITGTDSNGPMMSVLQEWFSGDRSVFQWVDLVERYVARTFFARIRSQGHSSQG